MGEVYLAMTGGQSTLDFTTQNEDLEQTNQTTSSNDTDLNLNGKIFKAYNINQAGDENSNGLAFDLKSDFSIVAQNTSDFLVLKLIITSRLTDKIVFQEEVGQYGVIRISN